MTKIYPVPLRSSESRELTKPGFLDALKLDLQTEGILGKH